MLTMKKPENATAILPIAIGGEQVIALDCELLLDQDGPQSGTTVTHLRFADLTPDLLAATGASLIILPLFAPTYDAMTAVETLEDLGYAGKLTVLGPRIAKAAPGRARVAQPWPRSPPDAGLALSVRRPDCRGGKSSRGRDRSGTASCGADRP